MRHLNRPLEGNWPYLWIDATYVKTRQAGCIVSVAVIIAVGVNADGRREVLGMDISAPEAEVFWTAFLRSLTRRGLRAVQLVISDNHRGIKAAVEKVLSCTWQRCCLHFMCNAMAHAGKRGKHVVAAFIATTLAQVQCDPWNAGVSQSGRRRPGFAAGDAEARSVPVGEERRLFCVAFLCGLDARQTIGGDLFNTAPAVRISGRAQARPSADDGTG